MDGVRRWRRGYTPPILTLLDLLSEHRGAFEYDWRTRFQKSVNVIGTRKMSYGEAWRLAMILLGDMSSQVAASVAGWDGPLDRIDATLRDLFDLQHMIGAAGSKKKPKPYPRPWPDKQKTRTLPGAEVTRDQVIAALRFAGHAAALPGEKVVSAGRPRDARGRFVKRG